MAYEEIKIPTIIAFYAIMLIFGSLPVCIKKFRETKLLMSLSNCFTAGLFLATGLIHVLPEADALLKTELAVDPHAGHDHRRILQEADSHDGHDHGSVSWSHFVLLMGFSFILFVEKVLLNWKKKKPSPKNKTNTTQSSTNLIEHEDNKIQSKHTDAYQLQNEQDPMNPDSENGGIDYNTDAKKPEIQADPEATNHTHNHDDDHGHDDHHGHDHLMIDESSSMMSIIVVLFALGIHGFMANLAVGLDNNKDTLITLIISVALHKWSEGLAVGIILAKKKFSMCKKMIIINIIAIFTPLGGITGLLLESANAHIQGTMLSISAAAFLYIAVIEIILEEFQSPKWKWLKYLMYMLGIGLVMTLYAVN